MSANNNEEILVRPLRPFSGSGAYMLTQPFPLFLQPGDIVAVNHGLYGRKEGLVVGSSVDYAVSPKQFAGVQIFVLTFTCHEGPPSC